MRKIEINRVQYDVHPALANYAIHRKPSSNVAFYGFALGSVFVQFMNGSSYIYNEVPDEVISDAAKAESIGSFVSRNLVKKFPSVKLNGAGVVPSTADLPI